MMRISKLLIGEKRQKIIIPVASVLLGFLLGGIIILLTGKNPINAYSALLKGAGFYGNLLNLGNTLLMSTALILTGLSVAFAFRTGLFNIGASGQMLVGGFFAVYLGIVLDLPKVIHLPICILASMIFGALWALIPAILKAKYKIHEVVTTIMMNWIAFWSVSYFVPLLIKGKFNTQSATIKDSASLRVEWMSNLFNGSKVNLGLILAIIAVFLIWLILEKTTFGYELKAVGFNKDAAEYAGIKVNRNIVYSMMIAGALSGLAGATVYIGYSSSMQIGHLPSQGFDGIAVALLGLNEPIGAFFAAILIGAMNSGKIMMQVSEQIPSEIVSVITGIIIFFASAKLMVKELLNRIERKAKQDGGDK